MGVRECPGGFDSRPPPLPFRLLQPRTAATHVTALSADGGYSASIPLTEAMPLGEVHARSVDGEPILQLHIPGGMTLCWNVKDLGLLRVTAGPEPDTVPENPPH